MYNSHSHSLPLSPSSPPLLWYVVVREAENSTMERKPNRISAAIMTTYYDADISNSLFWSSPPPSRPPPLSPLGHGFYGHNFLSYSCGANQEESVTQLQFTETYTRRSSHKIRNVIVCIFVLSLSYSIVYGIAVHTQHTPPHNIQFSKCNRKITKIECKNALMMTMAIAGQSIHRVHRNDVGYTTSTIRARMPFHTSSIHYTHTHGNLIYRW